MSQPVRAAPAAAQRPIGVFDSGIGGLSILRALRSALPAERMVYLADAAHAPYGERDTTFVAMRTLALGRTLVDQHGCKLLVVACNTATAAAVEALRAAVPGIPVVGVEPALKPAAQATRTGRVVVFATRGTLASERLQRLHASLASHVRFTLQPCDGLAAAIEADDAAAIERLCMTYVQASGPFGTQTGTADTLVLGCTHYSFAAPVLQRLAGAQVQLLDTGPAVARQAHRLLQSAGLLADGTAGAIELLSTGERQSLQTAAARWLPAADPR